jgi:hypothetical protein
MRASSVKKQEKFGAGTFIANETDAILQALGECVRIELIVITFGLDAIAIAECCICLCRADCAGARTM